MDHGLARAVRKRRVGPVHEPSNRRAHEPRESIGLVLVQVHQTSRGGAEERELGVRHPRQELLVNHRARERVKRSGHEVERQLGPPALLLQEQGLRRDDTGEVVHRPVVSMEQSTGRTRRSHVQSHKGGDERRGPDGGRRRLEHGADGIPQRLGGVEDRERHEMDGQVEGEALAEGVLGGHGHVQGASRTTRAPVHQLARHAPDVLAHHRSERVHRPRHTLRRECRS